MSTRKHIFQLLDTTGDGTGTTSAIGDYLTTPTSFFFKQAELETVHIHRMIVTVRDTGAFDAAKYGNGITLADGIRLFHKDADDEVLEELTAFPVKTSGDWAGQCFDVDSLTFGTGDELLVVRWTFAKSGLPLIIHFNKGEYLEIPLTDDFSNLVDHKFKIDGVYVDEDL